MINYRDFVNYTKKRYKPNLNNDNKDRKGKSGLYLDKKAMNDDLNIIGKDFESILGRKVD